MCGKSDGSGGILCGGLDNQLMGTGLIGNMRGVPRPGDDKRLRKDRPILTPIQRHLEQGPLSEKAKEGLGQSRPAARP